MGTGVGIEAFVGTVAPVDKTDLQYGYTGGSWREIVLRSCFVNKESWILIGTAC